MYSASMINVYCHEVKHWDDSYERVYYYFEYQLDIFGKKHRLQRILEEERVFEMMADGEIKLHTK